MAATATAAPKKSYTPAEAASLGLGWVDPNHPLYGTKGYVGSEAAAQPTASSYTPPAGAPAPTNQAGAAAAASTYSATPGAAPTTNTTNQGSQDVYRNALISQMTTSETPDVNDPVIQAQLQPFAAAQERARADEVRRGAEEAFGGGQDYGAPERVVAAEHAGQNTGLMASDLVGRELQARRDKIANAMTMFGNTLSDDQRRALEDKLGVLDNSIRQQGLAQTGQLGNRELDVRNNLGQQQNNIDLIRALLQNKQFGQDLGFHIGATAAGLNSSALQSLFG